MEKSENHSLFSKQANWWGCEYLKGNVQKGVFAATLRVNVCHLRAFERDGNTGLVVGSWLATALQPGDI